MGRRSCGWWLPGLLAACLAARHASCIVYDNSPEYLQAAQESTISAAAVVGLAALRDHLPGVTVHSTDLLATFEANNVTREGRGPARIVIGQDDDGGNGGGDGDDDDAPPAVHGSDSAAVNATGSSANVPLGGAASSSGVSSSSSSSSSGGSSSSGQKRLQEEQEGEQEQGFSGGYAAVCTMTRDQHEDLAEWVEHHLALGFSRIYVLDDKSSPPLLAKLLPYIRSGRVVYSYMWAHTSDYRHSTVPTWDGKGAPHEVDAGPQLWAFNHCTREYGSRHRWVAFIDTDEFLMFTDGSRDLPGFLRGYEGHGGLAVNWWEYGSDGHVLRPQQGGVIANYRRCRVSSGVKTIANTAGVLGWTEVHHPVHAKGWQIVDEAGNKVKSSNNGRKSSDRVFLAHYVTKSRQDFVEKRRRGYGSGAHARPQEFFDIVDSQVVRDCNESLAYVQPHLAAAATPEAATSASASSAAAAAAAATPSEQHQQQHGAEVDAQQQQQQQQQQHGQGGAGTLSSERRMH